MDDSRRNIEDIDNSNIGSDGKEETPERLPRRHIAGAIGSLLGIGAVAATSLEASSGPPVEEDMKKRILEKIKVDMTKTGASPEISYGKVGGNYVK
jgi:hypothetical protein